MRALPVYFTPKQAATDNNSFSPSAGKPPLVVESWRRRGVPLELHEPAPVTREQLALAHDPRFVEDVLECRRENGFGNTRPGVAASLPYTSGSFLAAARAALANGQVAVSPTSGFHHAHYARPEGFCTFNGLIVAARALKQDKLVDRVGILDLDQHYGNGTDDIIRRLGLDYIEHWTLGAHHEINLRTADAWLDELGELIRGRFKDCDVLFYQAGADPHEKDPLGGRLTTEHMSRRDQIVFATCKAMGLPVAWNLAGGYQEPISKVLALHDNTALRCVETFVDGKAQASAQPDRAPRRADPSRRKAEGRRRPAV